MSKLDILLLAFKNFRRRMMRSVLTIIGVVIGSMAIIVMVSLGIGIQQNMTMMVEQWGDLTTITVNFWNLDRDGGGGGGIVRSVGGGGTVVAIEGGGGSGSGGSRRGSNEPNIYEEAIRIIESLEHVVAATPLDQAWGSGVRLVSGRYVNPWPSITLVDASRLHYFNFPTSEGRMLQAGDGDFAIVLSPHAGMDFVNLRSRNPWDWSARPTDEYGNIIPFVDIFNDEIQLTFDDRYGERPQPGQQQRRRARLHDIEIVGVQQAMGMYQWNNFMDRETFNNHRREHLQSQIRQLPPDEATWLQQQLDTLDDFMQGLVRVDHRDNVPAVMEQLQDLGYEPWSNIGWIENVDAQMAVVQMVMGAIGAVALLVAAINIANTMIMSIYERTKEIGIMKVIGCRLGDICLLFLSEAAILGIIGGIVGVLASFGASALINNLPPDTVNQMFGIHLDPAIATSLSVIPLWLILIALGIASGIAIIAGLYPSIRAMRLSALEAIRTE